MRRRSSHFLDYPKVSGRYDEVWGDDGPRPHFRALLDQLGHLSDDALREREAFVRKAIAEDGVTYNVYADSLGDKRPWDLDVLPLILPAREWREIARGVAQRARLLDAVLADLLGPRRLVAKGLVPPALVFGQLGYPWPAVGITPPGGVFLHLYAADVARAPDGRFWVLADRSQAPSGAAYALQNRMTLARAFPDAFRELSVEPLGAFFTALQDSLARLSPARGEPPLVVLLTPGPLNETYFEHVFLARHLGFPLVEGQDLIVRRDLVFLKTLRGLRRVHGILRRLDDDYCDPVELRADSALGVPGLLSAMRAGNVLVANAIGSGILETGALHGFLPAICEALLGEPLALPAVASYWCGERPALEHVCQHLDELVIKPTYSSMGMEPVFGHALGPAARAAMIDRLSAQPHAYVGQEWVHLSHAPALASGSSGRFVSRSVSMRVFAVATPDGFQVLPGALSRVAPSEGDVVSMQWGASSKDTWVLAEGPRDRAAPARRKVAVKGLVHGVAEVPSRVGENLFWLGRYSERCEAIARLLRAGLVRLADASADSRRALGSIAAACEALGVLDAGAPARGLHDAEQTARFVSAVADPEIAGGLAANVARLCGSAGHVRERMSTDNWHVLGRLPRKLPRRAPSVGEALESLDEIMLVCVSLAGFAMDDMTRDESWRFLLLGRRIERMSHLAGVASTVLSFSEESRDASLEWLLEAANSIVTYRARHRAAPELLPVLHLVLLDRSNPHSVMFQAQDLLRNLESSAEELGSPMPSAPLVDLSRELAALDLSTFESGPAAEACASLAGLVSSVRAAAFDLSDALHRRFFSHAGTPAPLGV